MPLPPPGPDRSCLVTGASSGIGVELARELVVRGYGVTLVARREQRLRALATELCLGPAGSGGVRVEVLPADLTDPEQRAALPGRLADLGLQVPILVNCAGWSTVGQAWRQVRSEELAMIRLDVEAVVDLCGLFIPGMVDRKEGAVLNVASTAAFQPLPGMSGYAAAKAFVLSYSQSVNCELKGTGVWMTALCPGPVKTEFVDTSGMGEVTQTAPNFVWTDVHQVARDGIAGLAARKAVVIPGTLNKVGALGAHHAPRSLLLPVLKRTWPALRVAAKKEGRAR